MEFQQIRLGAISDYTRTCKRQNIVLRQLQAISMIEQDLSLRDFNHAYRSICEIEPALKKIEDPKRYCTNLDQTRKYFLNHVLQLETSKITMSEQLTEKELENRLIECFQKTLIVCVPHSKTKNYLFKEIYNGRFPADLTLFKDDLEDIPHNFITQGAFLYTNEQYRARCKDEVVAEIQEQQAIKQRCEYTLYNRGITEIKSENKDGLFFYSLLKTLEEEQIKIEEEIEELRQKYNKNKPDQKLESDIMRKIVFWFKKEFQQQSKLSKQINLDITKVKYEILFNSLINKTEGFMYHHESVLWGCHKLGYSVLQPGTTKIESRQPLMKDLRYTNIIKERKLEDYPVVSKVLNIVDCSRKGKDHGLE